VKRRGVLREHVIRVLPNEPGGTLTKYRLAKKSECSFSWLHEFIGKLEELRVVKDTQVTDYSGLVKYWLSIDRSTGLLASENMGMANENMSF